MGKKEDFERGTEKLEQMIKEKEAKPAPPTGTPHERGARCCPNEYIGR